MQKSRGVIYHCVRFFVSGHRNITGKSRDFALYTVLLPIRIAGDIAVCIAGNAFCCSTVTAGYHIFCLTIIAGYRIFFRHIRFAAGHLFCKQHVFCPSASCASAVMVSPGSAVIAMPAARITARSFFAFCPPAFLIKSICFLPYRSPLSSVIALVIYRVSVFLFYRNF